MSRAALVLLAFLPIEANAQGLTGTLVGTVKDGQGGVLSAAIVRVLSPALMTGEERTTSNDKGQWRFPVLPPGQYRVARRAAAEVQTLSSGRPDHGGGPDPRAPSRPRIDRPG